MLGEKPLFEINNDLWPIHASRNDLPATKIMGGEIINSIIAEGTVVHNARIKNSVVRRGVIIEDGVEIVDSIIMDHVVLKKDCRLNKVIVDSFNVIEEGVSIGYEGEEHYFRATRDPSGISVIASEKQTGRL
jgi:glucose-1-phosphate adenylyltransferase